MDNTYTYCIYLFLFILFLKITFTKTNKVQRDTDSEIKYARGTDLKHYKTIKYIN